ncbi:hypothetical protein [Polaribacter glomeratus]|nr:hypothetical protein [Polaribacter glomeratus]TXD66561.1 hypothetical protein ESX12_03305 [Polaribacter glomeratus]
MQVKNYTHDDYINAINSYPKFWTSIRENTLKTNRYNEELNNGVEKIRAIYPQLKPAKIYFTIGALRSNGTTIDSLVLIGSELAMADKNTNSAEFDENLGAGRRIYFDSNPIDNLVLLNLHEYVHTQQKPRVNNLLSYVLHEGIAEFVSVIAMNVPSSTPAINYGKQNKKVKQKFEEELFYGNNTHHWLWSDFKNEFDTRDLGYYIGYAIAEINYNNAINKQAAIKKMIELDYTNEADVEDFVNRTKFFSKPINKLYADFDKSRPTILSIEPVIVDSTTVNPNLKRITLNFSMPMNVESRGFDYGPLGENHVLSVQNIIGFTEDAKSFTFEIALEPDKHYQSLITNRFLSKDGIPLKPFLINFKTSKK